MRFYEDLPPPPLPTPKPEWERVEHCVFHPKVKAIATVRYRPVCMACLLVETSLIHLA